MRGRDTNRDTIVTMENPNEVYEHRETKEHGGAIQQYFEALGVDDDPTIRRDQFAKMPTNDYLDLVGTTATLVRHGNAQEITNFDGTFEYALAGNRVPRLKEDKIEAMGKMWSLAEEFLDDASIPDKEALAYAAIIASNSITLAHPFEDANGRTSRVLSYAIFNGIPGDKVYESTLSKSGGIGIGENTWNLDAVGTYNHFDKEDFSSELQPDLVECDPSKSKEMGIHIREWLIRAIIDNYGKSEHVQRSLRDNENEVDGKVELDGNSFLESLLSGASDLEKEQIKLDLRNLEHTEAFIGNFMRMMKTDSPFLHDSESGETLISVTDIMNDIDKDKSYHELFSQAERRRNMLRYFTPDVDFDSQDSVKHAIESLPLRKQFLIDRAGAISSFDISNQPEE